MNDNLEYAIRQVLKHKDHDLVLLSNGSFDWFPKGEEGNVIRLGDSNDVKNWSPAELESLANHGRAWLLQSLTNTPKP